jgi:phosphohistidine swiveling domain-containing protein
MKIVQKFKSEIQGKTLYNPVFNFIPLLASLGWYEKRFFECYKNLPVDPILSLANENMSIWYITLDQLRPMAIEFGVNFMLEENNPCIEQYQKYSKIVDGLYEQILPTTYEEMGEIESFDLLQKMIEAEKYTNAAGWFSILFEREIAEEVLSKSGVAINPQKLDEIIEKSSDPVRGSFDMRAELLTLGYIANGSDLDDVAQKMQYKFSGFNGSESVLKVKNIISGEYKIYFANKDKVHERITELQTEIERKGKSYAEWKSTLEPDELKFSEYVQHSSTMKDALRDFIGKSVAAIHRIVVPLAQSVGIEASATKFLLYPEILRGTDHLNTIKTDVQKRNSGFGMLMYPDNTYESEYGDISTTKTDLENFYMKQYGLETETGVTSLKGQPASKGFVKGRVRKIIDLESEGSSMCEGEILVTGMTRPEFVPLMKMAGAIVTDEGGVTCHAAIVSRELKKPCIIGTKIATKILKTGDLVEVDADKGIVKILK